MSPILITIPGEPVAAGRTRSFVQRGRMVVTTPPKYRAWLKGAKRAAQVAMLSRPALTRPVTMRVHAAFSVPNSWPSWKRDAVVHGQIEHTSKPDLDNVIKACADALTGIVLCDDTQITEIEAVKAYALQPGVTIEITERPVAPSGVKSKRALEEALG